MKRSGKKSNIDDYVDIFSPGRYIPQITQINADRFFSNKRSAKISEISGNKGCHN